MAASTRSTKACLLSQKSVTVSTQRVACDRLLWANEQSIRVRQKVHVTARTSHLVLVAVAEIRKSQRTSWKRWHLSYTLKNMADSQRAESNVSNTILCTLCES